MHEGLPQRRVSAVASMIQEKLRDHRLTQQDLAQALGVSRRSVNQLLNERRSLTAEMAHRLAQFWETSPEFWLNLQMRDDLRYISTLTAQCPVPTIHQFEQRRNAFR